MSAQELQTLHGTVEGITYYNEETGYIVLSLDAGGELVTVVGELPGIVVGEEVQVGGSYTNHATYGLQFRAQYAERKLPATAAAIEKYLCGGALRGVGPRTARRLVEAFGDATLSIIEKQPERLVEVKGITPKKAQQIAEEYRHIFGIRAVMIFLSQFGVEAVEAIRAWKRWGVMAQEIVSADPFALCSEDIGIQFEVADLMAEKLEIDRTSPLRVRAGLLHVLTHNLTNGHTCLPADKLAETARTLLDIDLCLVEDAMERCVDDDELISDRSGGMRFIYLPDLYEAETYIAGRIMLMLQVAPPPAAGKTDGAINTLETGQGISYAHLQRKAIAMALVHNIFILTGGPGTGKTTTLNALLSLLEERGENVVLAAPTGRAAKRMAEVTGREAKTIHRLLEVDFRGEDQAIKFKRDEKNPLAVDTIILDEASMVDTRLMHCLMRAMRISTRLVLVGDPDQLPSVGAGNILRDLIASDVVPTVHLSEIFRQAQQSAIVSSAHSIVRGEDPDLSHKEGDFFFMRRTDYAAAAQTVAELCTRRLPAAYGLSPLWDIQVIAPSRVGALGTVELNRLLQQEINPADPAKTEQKFGAITLREGDKIMQVRNNYDIVWQRDDGEQGAGVFNGDIGLIEMIDRPSQTILIRYDDRVAQYNFEMMRDIEHAYAITVHKSQGSEFEAVVMPLMNFHQRLYYRNILYTCVTRARRLMIVIGKQETVHRMVASHRKVLRYTGLERFLLSGQ